MEKNNEKDLRLYIQPETVLVELNGNATILQASTLEPGHGTNPI